MKRDLVFYAGFFLGVFLVGASFVVTDFGIEFNRFIKWAVGERAVGWARSVLYVAVGCACGWLLETLYVRRKNAQQRDVETKNHGKPDGPAVAS